MTMTPALLAQHQARQARLRRFAEAAARHVANGQTRADAQQSAVLECCLQGQPAAKVRREYECKDRPSAYVPVAWRILRAIALEFDLTIDEIISQHREPKFTVPRYVAIGLMLDLTGMSLPAIGRRLGGRDHTTVLNGRNRINALLQSEAFRNRFDQIKAGLAV